MPEGDVDGPGADPGRDGARREPATGGESSREAGPTSGGSDGALGDHADSHEPGDVGGNGASTSNGGGPAPETGDAASTNGDAGEAGDDGEEYGPEDRGSGLLGEHAHETPHPEDWPWLQRGDEKGIDKHPYCEDCGLVKYVGPDRPLPGGGLVNLLARLKDRLERDGRTLADAQKRIILQRLRDRNVDDDWGLDRERQLDLFEGVVAEVTGVEPSYLHGVLHEILERRGKV